MLWLNYIRQDGAAYADLKKYLDDLKLLNLELFTSAKDMDHVNRLKGRVDCLVELQLAITQEERADRERAQRAESHARESRGESRTR